MSAAPLVLWLALAGGPARWMDLPEAERAQALAALPDGPLPARLLAVSERFLDTPYGFSPLGEGQGKDPDPLIRFDLVDCLTYVEETIALSLARSPDQVAPLLAALRYQKQVLYEDRNHLMEAQWLPSNVKKGFLKEATAKYGGPDVQRSAKVITAATWRTPSSQALELPEERQLVGRFPLELLPLDKAAAHVHQVPSGTLMLVVREDLPGKVTRITHLGFVVQKGKRTFLRHASRNPFMRVVDEDVESFFTRNARYEKWRVDGVSFYDVLPKAASDLPGGP
jgi:N-acetylmuramoyl-L-alanine amidase-like protein